MTTISQDANLPNCILNQLELPAVILFSNSFEQIYKNSYITGFNDIGFWELETHSSFTAIALTAINSIANDVSIAVSQTNKWALAINATTPNFFVRSSDGGNTWASVALPVTPTGGWAYTSFGNAIWLMVRADTGAFYTSPSSDAGSWTLNAYAFPDAGIMRAARFRDGEWIAISRLGDIARSTGGTTWTTVNSTIFTDGRDIEYSFTTSDWMAVGLSGGVGRAAISLNEGVTWSLTSGLLPNCTGPRTVEYHNNAWLIGGIASSGLGLWRSTDDGVNWTQLTSASTGLPTNGQIQNLDEIGEFRDTVIAMSITDGEIYFSKDGLSWLKYGLGPFEFN